MIHHYINLVCWRPMLAMYQPGRDVVWMDSVSITKLAQRYRSDAAYRPGTSVLGEMGPGAPEGGAWFFLTPAPTPSLPANAQYALPFFDTPYVPDDLARQIKELPSGTRIGLGISAPKQNELATLLYALRPDLEYHCLGAAIADLGSKESRDAQTSRLSGSGLEWLRFLVASLRRTWGKIKITLKETVLVNVHGPSRSDFKRFAEICAPANIRQGQRQDL